MPRDSIRVSLNRDEVSHIVGALRERIDGYEEQREEGSGDGDDWFEVQLAVLLPLERRLTKREGLMDPPERR